MAYNSPYRSGPPGWMVVLVGALLVFGGYFTWVGIRNYMSGSFALIGLTTEIPAPTSTSNVPPTFEVRVTLPPSRTPVPECMDFQVIVPEAIIRECANTACAIVETRAQGETVCVLERAHTNDEWFIIDLDASRFFTSLAFMHESLIEASNPTLTPSMTSTFLPSLTPAPTRTPRPTLAPSLTPATPTTPTPVPTFTPSPTPPLISG